MTHALSGGSLAGAADRVRAATGLHFPPSRHRELQRGLDRAARELGFSRLADCLNWLPHAELDSDAIRILATHLTVGETYFFRDENLFGHLERNLLPALIDARRASGRGLRIWCAGCCTGEEPYSLAIVLHRLIPDIAAWKISVLATDINGRALETARAGVYGPWSFRSELPAARARYFHRCANNSRSIRPELRSLVDFAYLNLADDRYPSPSNKTSAIDLLLCRNVLMYLAHDAAQEVLRKLAASLADDGWMAVAPSELALVPSDLFSPVRFDAVTLYQKKTARLPALSTGTAPPDIRPAPPAEPAQQTSAAGFAPPIRRAAETPAKAMDRLREAEALFRQHDYAAARAVLESISTAPEAMTLLARVSGNEGRLDDALLWCDRAISSNRSNPAGYYLRALVLRERGAPDEARAALRQAIYLDPDFIMAHFTLGALARETGDGAAWRRHWRSASRLLSACGADDVLPESDGMAAARLGAFIDAAIPPEGKS